MVGVGVGEGEGRESVAEEEEQRYNKLAPGPGKLAPGFWMDKLRGDTEDGSLAKVVRWAGVKVV